MKIRGSKKKENKSIDVTWVVIYQVKIDNVTFLVLKS